ncbi:MAG: hypothetical protein ACKO2P_17865 [Planctomycetota bacterium]
MEVRLQQKQVNRHTRRPTPAANLPRGLLMLLCTITGCLNPRFTRMPTWQTWSRSAENQAYEQHYPFTDPDIGPSTDGNPRGYDRPRTATRRAAEQRVFQGIPAGPESKPQSNAPRHGNRWRSSL